jgi:hypothetical protein
VPLKNFNIICGYLKFIFIGGFLGLISWITQLSLKYIFSFFVSSTFYQNFFSIFLAFFMVVLIGFFLHSKITFHSEGSLKIYFLINFFCILIVAVSASLLGELLQVSFPTISFLSYPIVAIFFSPAIFYLKHKFVYTNK